MPTTDFQRDSSQEMPKLCTFRQFSAFIGLKYITMNSPETIDGVDFIRQSTVLVIDDDEDSLFLLKRLLVKSGCQQVLTSANPNEAIELYMDSNPDLVLLDVMMPKVSGFDVLDILRNTPETSNLKIIMLTALSQQSDKDRAESLGVDDFLVKSQVVIADVVERIRHHLARMSGGFLAGRNECRLAVLVIVRRLARTHHAIEDGSRNVVPASMVRHLNELDALRKIDAIELGAVRRLI